MDVTHTFSGTSLCIFRIVQNLVLSLEIEMFKSLQVLCLQLSSRLIDFQGHGERLKTTKIRSRKIISFTHLFKRQFPCPVKCRMTWNLQILKEELLLLNQV